MVPVRSARPRNLHKPPRRIGPYAIEPPSTGAVRSLIWPIQATWTLRSFIDRLSEDTSDDAGNALESLAADHRPVNWRSPLLDRLHRQKSVVREAAFSHPSLAEVAEVLDNGRPANPADLAALTLDKLHQLSRRIRDGATSDWRQYWNVDKHNRALRPKPENACRDALLSDLRRMSCDTPVGTKAKVVRGASASAPRHAHADRTPQDISVCVIDLSNPVA